MNDHVVIHFSKARRDYLMHYASPYYDPVKAHEYYMQNRELKGRVSKGSLNDEGKSTADYVKERINEERDAKLAERANQYSQDSAIRKDKYTTDVENKQEIKNEELKQHSKEMNSKIDTLRTRLSNMSPAQKKKASAKIRQEIAELRENNASVRDRVNAEFKKDKAGMAEEYATDKSGIRDQYGADKKQIRKDYADKYQEELSKIAADPAYAKAAKGGSGKSKKEADSSPNRKSVGYSTWSSAQKADLRKKVQSAMKK